MRIFGLIILIVLLHSCKSKQTDLSKDLPIKPNEFVAAFKLLDNNFSAIDTSLLRFADKGNINTKLLSRFIPDSVIKSLTNNEKTTIFHALGRIEKNEEVYLLYLSVVNKTPSLIVSLFDKKNNYLASKNLFTSSGKNDNYRYTISINREPTFFINREKTVNDKDLKFTKLGWAYLGNKFIVVVKESNERSDKLVALINPLDTLRRENLYSGDYVEDDRNFISIRDGRTTQEYLFFLHIDKNEGQCVGELKGEMKLVDSFSAVYSMGGDPCVIDFKFDRNIITIKEKGSCGNRRGMDCFFEDAYTKKRVPKKKVVKPIVVKIPMANVTKMLSPLKPNNKKTLSKKKIKTSTILINKLPPKK